MARRPRTVFLGLTSLGVFSLAPMVTAAPSALAAQPPPPATSPALSMFTASETLKAPPPVLDARGLDPSSPYQRNSSGAVAVGIDEVVGTHRFHTQLGASPSFGYLPAGASASDVYLGPTIEAQRGTPIALTVTNKLTGRHPYASYFDPTIMGTSQLDAYAPRTSTHLHGGHTPPASDGGPDETYRAQGLDPDDYAQGSGSYTYTYPNDQEATTLWYHDHALAMTRFNPMAGLAAFYLIRDSIDTGRTENPLGLPANIPDTVNSTGKTYEWPLVLQDRMFKDKSGALNYPTNYTTYHPTWAPESFGDVATVNGQAWANLNVDRGMYRFRLLNGSNARFYNLTLMDKKTGNPTKNVPIYQIGSEGGLFNKPVPITSTSPGLLIAPGERADLLVDFRGIPAGSVFQWYNNANAPYPTGPNSISRGGVPLQRILQFTVGATTGYSPPAGTAAANLATATLRAGAQAITALTSTKTRTMFLNEVIDPVTFTPVQVLINNLTFHDGDALRNTGIAIPKLNTVETWEIVNTTMDAHPIHLHMTQFQVLNRQTADTAAYLAAVNANLPTSPKDGGTGVQGSNGTKPAPDLKPYLKGSPRPPAANEIGWKDTVRANPGEVVRIIVPFGGSQAGIKAAFDGDTPTAAVQRFVGRYVWHCHILEHEENDMMQSYTVSP
jgi:FtsP/CotA-like multicopper oxidase with cupredoxin domain